MGNNMKRLGNVLAGRMQSTAKKNIPTTLELGKINDDMSLSVDGLNNRIMPNDYMVDIRLTHKDYKTDESLLNTHSHRMPSVFRKLKGGDRVLVAWIGYEPIIVAIVVSGTTETE